MPDLLKHIGNDNQVRNELVESWDIAELRFYNQTDSTQNIARALAEAGAPEWTVVVADYQTGGRGQQGRQWFAEPGKSLLFSLLLRPEHPDAMALTPIRAGIIIARGLDRLLARGNSEHRTALKWPNDIVIADGKVGGILCEGAIRGAQYYTIIGVGINVHRFDVLPMEHAELQPVFLEDFLGPGITRLKILETIVMALRESLQIDQDDLMPLEVEEYAERDWLRGRELAAPLAGRAAGINRRGHLLVEGLNDRVDAAITGGVVLGRGG